LRFTTVALIVQWSVWSRRRSSDEGSPVWNDNEVLFCAERLRADVDVMNLGGPQHSLETAEHTCGPAVSLRQVAIDLTLPYLRAGCHQ